MARTQVRVTPEQATSKWTSRLQQATTEMQQGVARVTEAPGMQAAAKFDKWLAGVQAGVAKWRRNVASVSVDQWKSAMTNIGIPRVGQGATQKAGKYQAFAADFYPFLQSAMARVNAMPDATFEQRVAKSTAMQQALHGYKRGGTSGVGAGATGA